MTASSDRFDLDAFNRRLEQQLREQREAERQARYKGLPELAPIWLALAPSWTIPLAEACRFPTDGLAVEEVFARLERLGVLRTSGAPVRRPVQDQAPTREAL